MGHHGFLTHDRVLFTGDALYQEQIWERHRLPYAIDPTLVVDSLDQIRSVGVRLAGARSRCRMRPGTGRATTSTSTWAQVREIQQFIVDSLVQERTTEEAIALVSERRGLSDNPAQYWLAVTTVKGFLGDLLARGEVEFFVRDHAGGGVPPGNDDVSSRTRRYH